MNQQNDNNNSDRSRDVHPKRKRGRPRKYHRVEWEENADNPPVTQNVNRENSQVPPGFERIHGNQSSQREEEKHADNVGNEVSGVVEASFKDGYLLSIKIGNSDTIWSGLAFKPGRHVPISVMAPDVSMIDGNAVPFLTETSPQPQEQHVYVNGSSSVSQVPTGEGGSSNLAISLGKNVSSVAEQTTHSLTIGNKVVPIVHPPSNNQQPQVLTQTSPADGNQAQAPSARGEVVPILPRPSNLPPQVMTTQPPLGIPPAVGNIVPSIQIQPSKNTMLPRGLQNEDYGFDPSSAMEMNDAEDISMRLPDMPFEKLVTEVVKRIPDLSDFIVTETGNNRKSSGVKKPVKDSSSNPRVPDVQAGPMEHPAFTTKPLEIRNTRKVSVLLEALQCKSNAEPET